MGLGDGVWGRGQGPTVPGPPPASFLTTLRETTAPAHQTAALVFDGTAAVRAGGHGHGGGRGFYLRHVGEHFGDGVGAGEHLVPVLPDGAGAADAGDLLDDGVDAHAGAQRQRDEAAGGFDLGGGAAPGFPHLGEDFAEAQVILVDGDVELAAAGVDEFRGAVGAFGPGPGGDVLQFLGFLFAEA